jgi:hypothetical protein
MAYTDQASLAKDAIFQIRVRVAMLTAAVAVQSELTSIPNHTNRSNYAKLVLNAPDSYLYPFAQAVTTNAAITAASLDSDIQFQSNSIWNAMAGVI